MSSDIITTCDDLDSQTIKRLPKEVVNRIAAGEVIQRPANAIKELLENCLDAGSTQIQVTVREGGLKLLQVQDNGCGIRLSDLPILCERFTTSKLREFSELNSLSTFGFRGEALSSISHVALVTVITRTKDQRCAYKVAYRNGVPNGKPVSCAGNFGTTIIAEDLFYNAPLRRNALRNAREEFARVAEVVAQYSIHYAHKCGFHLRSLSTSSSSSAQELRTVAGWSRMDAVRVAIGNVVAQNLINLSSSQSTSSEATRFAVERFGLRYEGLLTAPSQITSGGNPTLKLSLFINNRMVSSLPIKRAIEAAYGSIISRALSSPVSIQGSGRKISTPGRATLKTNSSSDLFVYLNLQLPANTLDVNVHPTKAEVHFLHEDEIINGIQDAVHNCLLASSQVRSFLTSSLPTANLKSDSEDQLTLTGIKSTSQNPNKLTNLQFVNRPQDKVRIDLREQTLERFVVIPQISHQRLINSNPVLDVANDNAKRSETSSDSNQVLEGFVQPDQTLSLTVVKPCQNGEALKEIHPTNISQETRTKTILALSDNGEMRSDLSARPLIKNEQSNQNILQSCSSTLLSSIIDTSRSTRIRRLVHLESVHRLRKEFESQVEDPIKILLRSCKFLGLIDETRCLAQHATELLLIRLRPLTMTLFYQLLIFNFANHGEIILEEPVHLKLLLTLGYKLLSGSNDETEIKTFVEHSVATLIDKAPMLWDYYSIRIEMDSENVPVLSGLPLLLNNYVPNLQNLPVLIVRLVKQVDWTDELACFKNICRIIAEFYALSKDITPQIDTLHAQSDQPNSKENLSKSRSSTHWMIEHVIWPQLTNYLLPSSYLCDRFDQQGKWHKPMIKKKNPLEYAFIRLTKLSDLYKVFERC